MCYAFESLKLRGAFREYIFKKKVCFISLVDPWMAKQMGSFHFKVFTLRLTVQGVFLKQT